MADQSARDLFGDAFPQRTISVEEEFNAESVKVDVYRVPATGNKRQRELIDSLKPPVTIELIGSLHGPGRFFLDVKRVLDNKYITQAIVDIKPGDIPSDPRVLEQEPSDPDDGPDEELPDIKSMIAEGVRDAMKEAMREMLPMVRPPAPVAPAHDELIDVLKTLALGNQKQVQGPDVTAKAIAEAMSIGQKMTMQMMQGQFDLKMIEAKQDLELKREYTLRGWEREDEEFKTRQTMLLRQLEDDNEDGKPAIVDPEGTGGQALVEALKDMFGMKESKALFGIDMALIEKFVTPALPALVKSLEDRGVYVLTQEQVEYIGQQYYAKGKSEGQAQVIEARQEVQSIPRRPRPITTTAPGVNNGFNGRPGMVNPQAPGFDNPDGGEAGGGRGDDAAGAQAGGAGDAGEEDSGVIEA